MLRRGISTRGAAANVGGRAGVRPRGVSTTRSSVTSFTEPVRAHELAIVPVRPGTYRVLIGTLKFRGAPVARATFSRVGD